MTDRVVVGSVQARDRVGALPDSDYATGRKYEEPHRTARRGIMSTLRILSYLGDEVHTWDAALAAAGDPEALEAVREAERIFAAARARGGTAFRVAPGEPAERLESFAPETEQIIIVPHVSGGSER
jgi:hypothetical protein